MNIPNSPKLMKRWNNKGSSMSRIKNLTVMGSGVLGGQIAWHSAFKGKTVTVPQIWLRGEYFGDSETVAEAHKNGKLKEYSRFQDAGGDASSAGGRWRGEDAAAYQ